MSRYKYDEFEKQLNTVLKHQDEELSKISFPSLEDSIARTESLLKGLGYQLDGLEKISQVQKEKKTITVPSWNELYLEAKTAVGKDCELEDLFTEDELEQNSLAVQLLNEEYKSIHKLDDIDIAIAALGGLIGAAVDILMVGVPQKTKEGLKAGPLSDYIREYFDRKFPADEMQKLANSKISKVPFDAQDNRHTQIYVDGLSAYYHRLLQLGHDPILGFVIGVNDILRGQMTTIDKKGKIVVQKMQEYSDRTEKNIFAAIAKEFIHLKSDVTTSMGLPAPLMSLFNLFQFGSIGEAEQTIAEIAQGMYFEGYDFIHFCSQSVSTMIVEVFVRLGYAVKRIKNGFPVGKAIPCSLDRTKNPKLATMLFIGHSAAAAANAGKLVFAKNPIAINYPEWITFAVYSFKQLKWTIVDKPGLQDRYVQDIIAGEFDNVIKDVNTTFNSISEEYTIIFQ